MMDPRVRERFSRQILFADIGEQGQDRLCEGSAVLIGCGALGTALANLLVRSGIGRLRIVDRDFVETSNLQRQTLFEESDAAEAIPKAVAAQRRLEAIDSHIKIEGMVADLTPSNVEELLGDFPLLLDGTDNFETRLLLNDYAVKKGVPWVYGAVVSSYGVTTTIRPRVTACLACITEGADAEPGDLPVGAEATCDTVGVLGAAAGAIASIEAASAIQLLVGRRAQLENKLLSLDVWTGRCQTVRLARNANCRACGRSEFIYLEGKAQPHVTMCGRDSVQIHERRRKLDLNALGTQLSSGGNEVKHNEFLLRLQAPPYQLTVFADGRAIIKGTRDAKVARSLYARFIGA